MDDPLNARLQPVGNEMGVQIPQQQDGLEEEQARGPNTTGSAEPGKDGLRDDWLDLKQQERADEDGDGEQTHAIGGYLYAATPVTRSPITRA